MLITLTVAVIFRKLAKKQQVPVVWHSGKGMQSTSYFVVGSQSVNVEPGFHNEVIYPSLLHADSS